MNKNKAQISTFVIDKAETQERYFEALKLAFMKFLNEESAGYLNTETRLMENIKAAKTLYKDMIR